MRLPTEPVLRGLFREAQAVADKGHGVVVIVAGPDAEHQFVKARPHRTRLLGALRIVEADIVDDTPRDESNA